MPGTPHEYETFLILNLVGAMVRTLFLSLQKANKLVRRPSAPPRRPPTRIGVIGAGHMGAGIAYVTARAGIDVVLLDRDQQTADRGKAYAEKREDRGIAKGRRSEKEKAALLGRIHPTDQYEMLADCTLVVEAVFENRFDLLTP